MIDYEEMILSMQESEEEDCKTCPYKGKACRNQCAQEEKIYNPVLVVFLK